MNKRIVLMVVLLAALVALCGLWGRSAFTDEFEKHRLINVTVENGCHTHVRIFYGRQGPQRPQDISTLAPHASVSQLMMIGEILWLLDDAGQELDRVTITLDTASIDVLPSCDALSTTLH